MKKWRNKKTGKVVKVNNFNGFVHLDDETKIYSSLAELNEEWEDCEEPKEYWYIDCYGEVLHAFYNGNEWDERRKEIGNYFETKEEAEKAVEKLKAWKRLKDRHFKFDDYDILNQTATWLVSREYDQYENDIKLLFGGEE